MRFISALLAGALAVVAAAQSGNGANPFTNTDFSGIAAGKPVTITWTPTTTGTVTLELVQGNPDALTTVATIEGGLTNSGSYTWTPSASIVKGSDYALKIVDDKDAENYNYTLQFPIDSDVTASSSPSSTKAPSSTEAPTSTEEPSSSTTEEPSTTSEEPSTTSEESTATETTSIEASSITDASSTKAATTTTSAPTTTSRAAQTSSSQGAAATGGAKVGAGLVGFVGAAMLLL